MHHIKVMYGKCVTGAQHCIEVNGALSDKLKHNLIHSFCTCGGTGYLLCYASLSVDGRVSTARKLTPNEVILEGIWAK